MGLKVMEVVVDLVGKLLLNGLFLQAKSSMFLWVDEDQVRETINV